MLPISEMQHSASLTSSLLPRTTHRHFLVLTGVPGSGKTLAGLYAVHSAVTTGAESVGDIVYLSGNTPPCNRT